MDERKMIYLDDAIDAVNSLTYPSSLVDVKRKLVELPSAQPEPLTDKEQRIFLAAYVGCTIIVGIMDVLGVIDE